MNVLVFGAGAIGTYIGGSLVFNGQRVVFLEKAKTADELREKNLRLEILHDGSSPILLPPKSFTVTGTLEEAMGYGPFDIAIYALKSYDTDLAVEQISPFAKDMPPVLCLSNGVENEQLLAAALGSGNIIAGTVTSSVSRRAVGDIILEKLRGVGVAEGHPLSLWIWEVFTAASLNPRLYQHPADMKWSKMLTNLLVNASVAILDMPPGEVLANPALFTIEMKMLRETLAVMKAQRIKVVNTPRTPVRLLATASRLPAFIARPLMIQRAGGGRGAKMPSFHIDLNAGKGKSEVEWLNGAVVRSGEKYGVATPVNKMYTDILSGLTRRDIPLTEYRHQPGKLIAMMERY